MARVAGFSPFDTDCRGVGCLFADRAVIPFPRNVLGWADNISGHAVIFGSGPGRLSAAPLWHGARGHSWRDGGEQFGPDVLVLGASVFIPELLCSIAREDRSAYKFGAITLAIILLIPSTGPAWQLAFHQFIEVSIGIGVALVMALI